jgi:hypothetical protein
MKNLRSWLVIHFAAMLGVPVKVRERYWLPLGPVINIAGCGSLTNPRPPAEH